MFAKNEKTGESWIIETTKRCYITDLNLALTIIAERLAGYKKHCKENKVQSHPYFSKRYLFDWTEIGTVKKLKEEVDWWLKNGYHISEIWCNMNGVVTIKIERNESYPFQHWLN